MRALETTLVLALVAVLGNGCMLRGPADVRREIVKQSGVELDRQFGMTFGRVSLAVARWVVDDDEIPLAGVRKVQVGVYRVVERDADAARLDPRRLVGQAWEPIVRVHEDEEDVVVFVREREQATRGLLVVVSDAEELVIVRVRGKLDVMLEEMMRYAFEAGGREDLFESAHADLERRRGATGDTSRDTELRE